MLRHPTDDTAYRSVGEVVLQGEDVFFRDRATAFSSNAGENGESAGALNALVAEDDDLFLSWRVLGQELVLSCLMDDQRCLFFDLAQVLAECPDPYGVAYELLRDVLVDVEALRLELGSFVDDLVMLGRVQQIEMPEGAVEEMRVDLARMAQEPRRLDVLFHEQTRKRCGRAAVPILASAIISASNWVEFAGDWLESVDGIRIQTDATLSRL